MKTINHSILGSGLSALIKDFKTENSVIFTDITNQIKKSKRFYEYRDIGGNTNIWGGYVNYKRYKFFLKNKSFKNFIEKNNFLDVRKFIDDDTVNKTYYLSRKNSQEIFRIKKNHFKNKIIKKKIDRIIIKKNVIVLSSNNSEYRTKSASLCLGNLGIIELLHNSNFLSKNDKITFYDGRCNYNLKIFSDLKKNYCIPMTLKEILHKLVFGKIKGYNSKISNTLVIQKFPIKYKKYEYSVEDILEYNSNNIRYFLSNHLVNLRINNIPLKKYVNNISNNLNAYCSGTCNRYLPGPISQDLIYNIIIG